MIEGKVGDRLVVESDKTGQARRKGVILEVLKGFGGTHYQVRWDDGHESTLFPSGGNLRIIESGKAEE